MQLKPCVHCRVVIMVGSEDARRAALPFILDTEPLDASGELDATRAGRRTWTMHSGGSIHLRTAATIRTRPAGITPRQTVHADHACRKGER